MVPVATKTTMETWAIKVTVATHAIVVLERLGDL
jgi:hypothetical protein